MPVDCNTDMLCKDEKGIADPFNHLYHLNIVNVIGKSFNTEDVC